MTDLHARAARIFGSSSDGVYWPYDASGIDRSLRKTDPKRYAEQLAELERKRLAIVEWAERFGLKASDSGCCPRWLLRNASRGCGYGGDCTYQGPDQGWLDHRIGWLKDGKPVAITTAPYHFGDDAQDRLLYWRNQHPHLSTAVGAGWYGFGTVQVLIWRTDLVETMHPAAP